jgi:hypothetical protein
MIYQRIWVCFLLYVAIHSFLYDRLHPLFIIFSVWCMTKILVNFPCTLAFFLLFRYYQQSFLSLFHAFQSFIILFLQLIILTLNILILESGELTFFIRMIPSISSLMSVWNDVLISFLLVLFSTFFFHFTEFSQFFNIFAYRSSINSFTFNVLEYFLLNFIYRAIFEVFAKKFSVD